MQTQWQSLLAVLLLIVALSAKCAAGQILPIPDKYLRGDAGSDVATAINRGTTEHRPIWIVAWDKTFFDTPDGHEYNPARSALKYFYDQPETKGQKVEGWIVRVACQGKILSVESNEPSLSKKAGQPRPQIDAANAKVPRGAAEDQGIK